MTNTTQRAVLIRAYGVLPPPRSPRSRGPQPQRAKSWSAFGPPA
jgi:hypothetical protein